MSKKGDCQGLASNSGHASIGHSLINSLRTAMEPEADHSLSESNSVSRQVLHVEPNADCRFLVSTLLQLHGYVVTSACTARQAREIIAGEPFDAYILDNSPFDQSGIDLCRHICGLNKDAPVIFYSGAAYRFDIEQGLEAGAMEYLTKPCGIEVLTDTLALVIHGRKLHELELERKRETPRSF